LNRNGVPTLSSLLVMSRDNAPTTLLRWSGLSFGQMYGNRDFSMRRSNSLSLTALIAVFAPAAATGETGTFSFGFAGSPSAGAFAAAAAAGETYSARRSRRVRENGSTRRPRLEHPVDGDAKSCRRPLAKARRATFGAVLAPIAWFSTDPATKVRANAAVGDDDARDVDAASAPTRRSKREDIAPEAQPDSDPCLQPPARCQLTFPVPVQRDFLAPRRKARPKATTAQGSVFGSDARSDADARCGCGVREMGAARDIALALLARSVRQTGGGEGSPSVEGGETRSVRGPLRSRWGDEPPRGDPRDLRCVVETRPSIEQEGSKRHPRAFRVRRREPREPRDADVGR
jgi:hypothetical protein